MKTIGRSAVALSLLVVGLTPWPARAQTRVLTLPPVDFNRRTTEFYRLRFNASAGVWGSAPGAFNVGESIGAGPFGFGPGTIGGFFTVDLPLIPTFRVGAGVDYNLRLGAGLRLDAGADAGQVVVNYPMDVEIEYPDLETVLPGQPFVVKTSFRPEATASFVSTGPTFRADLLLKTDFDALLAPAILPGNKFTLIDKAVHDDRKLFTLSRYFDSAIPKGFSCCNDAPGLAGIINGRARRPLLNGQGARGDANNPNALVSFVPDDDFLFAGIALNSFVSNSLILVPLSNTINLGLGDLEYHILELTPGLSAGVHQALRFEPHPMIHFEVRDENGQPVGSGATPSVPVGESVHFTGPPAGSALRLRPIIDKNSSFSNSTLLQATPAIQADPFRAAFHGRSVDLDVITVDVPSFSFNPGGGPLTLPFSKATFDLASYSSNVSLADDTQPTFPGNEHIITSDTRPPLLVDACRTQAALGPGTCSKALPPGVGSVQVLALVRRTPPDDVFIVNGIPTTSTFIETGDPGDIYAVDIPAPALARQGTVRLQVGTPGAFNIWFQVSNPLEMTVLWAAAPAPNLNPSVFIRQFAGAQNFGDACGDAGTLFGHLPPPPVDQIPPPFGTVLGTSNPLFESPCATEVLTAGGGLIGVGLDTTPLESVGVQVEWLDPQSVLTLDDVPLPTGLGATTTTVDQGGSTVYSTSYQLFALIPSTLQSLGGSHKLSLVNAGINATEPFSMDLQLDYPAPELAAVQPLSTADTTPGTVRLELTGNGFTPRTVALWDGGERTVIFRSRSLLLLDLPTGIATPGAHTVAVSNPSPGGGISQAVSYGIASEGTPRLELRASVFCSSRNRIAGLLTLNNAGTGPLRDARITGVALEERGKRYRVTAALPISVPYTGAGEANSVLVVWPSGVTAPRQGGTLIVDARLATGPVQLKVAVPPFCCAPGCRCELR
jgi:hypothetical protein